MATAKKETTALATPPINTLSFEEMLRDRRVQVQLKRVLPQSLSVEKMMQTAITIFRNNVYLQRCTPMSILSSLIEVSQLGLELDKARGCRRLRAWPMRRA